MNIYKTSLEFVFFLCFLSLNNFVLYREILDNAQLFA